MTGLLYTLIIFFITLGILIVFHEYGHFWVARRCGVKVLRFSVGFGKVLTKYTDRLGTEYVISAIPLGGYVQMVDENDETQAEIAAEDLPHAFNRQSLLKRIAIVLAGPVANILLAFIAFWLMYMVGMTTLAPIIGSVADDSIAASADIRANDEILAVDSHKVHDWQSINLRLLDILGRKQHVVLTVATSTGNTVEKTLDLSSWQVDSRRPDLITSLGLQPYFPKVEPIIADILPDSPAAQAGLQAGDRVVSVDNEIIDAWMPLVNYIQQHAGEEVELSIERNAIQYNVRLIPDSITNERGESIGQMGAMVQPVNWPDNLLRVMRYSPLLAIVPAIRHTVDITRLSFSMIGKLITGKVSVQSMAGPVGIAQGASSSWQLGMAHYLNFIGLVSIGLAILNLLPIPMLDGGHLLFYLIEAVRGRPVGKRLQLLGVKIGLIFLLFLMGIAFYNDFARLLG